MQVTLLTKGFGFHYYYSKWKNLLERFANEKICCIIVDIDYGTAERMQRGAAAYAVPRRDSDALAVSHAFAVSFALRDAYTHALAVKVSFTTGLPSEGNTNRSAS